MRDILHIVFVTSARRLECYSFSPTTVQIWCDWNHYRNFNSRQTVYSVTKVCFPYKLCNVILCIYSYSRGSVYSVSTTVPVSRQFATYNSIRIHWKKHVCTICCVPFKHLGNMLFLVSSLYRDALLICGQGRAVIAVLL